MPRVRASHPHRSWTQRVLLGVNLLVVFACLGSALALTRLRTTIENVPVVDIGSALAPSAEVTEPRNFLIIGTDSAAGLAEGDPVLNKRASGGQLADVIMILRVDPQDKSVRLLSIPRDSRVELWPSGKMERINAAMGGVDGEANLVQTIKRNFGIQIDNYVQVDFLSFRDLVEVLGGVPVYFTTPVRDENSGLAINEPGCKLLDPVQALSYARARQFYFYQDGKWRPDGTGDLGRISRQQDFIKRALRRAADKGMRNPSTALGVINAAASSVKMDSTLDVGTLLSLATQFQSFNPDALKSVQIPTFAAPRGGIAYQDIDWPAAEPLLQPFRGVAAGASPTKQQVIVDVLARPAQIEAATTTATQLDTAGFDAASAESRTAGEVTKIEYGPLGRDAAVLLAAQLTRIPQFEFNEQIRGYRVILTLGSDFAGVAAEGVPVDSLPADQLPPPAPVAPPVTPSTDSTVPPVGGEVDSETAGEPGPDEVNVPGVVPTDPVAAALCR
ncbi:MAG: LCP family protein [Microthrixaceae bacterium]